MGTGYHGGFENTNGAKEWNSERDVDKTFKSQGQLQSHFEKHGEGIKNVLRESSYTIDNYLRDANHIIKNGTYVPELNGYVRYMQGNKFGFVGLDYVTGKITTFHIKTIYELIKYASSLGLGR